MSNEMFSLARNYELRDMVRHTLFSPEMFLCDFMLKDIHNCEEVGIKQLLITCGIKAEKVFETAYFEARINPKVKSYQCRFSESNFWAVGRSKTEKEATDFHNVIKEKMVSGYLTQMILEKSFFFRKHLIFVPTQFQYGCIIIADCLDDALEIKKITHSMIFDTIYHYEIIDVMENNHDFTTRERVNKNMLYLLAPANIGLDMKEVSEWFHGDNWYKDAI